VAGADNLKVNSAARLHDTTAPPPDRVPIRVSEALAALSVALDLGEGRTPGHALRACLIGLDVGTRLGVPLREQRDFYYAVMLADAGCSTRGASRLRAPGRLSATATADLTALRASRAAEIVRDIGVGDHVADTVRACEERWDGGGLPRGLRGPEIPVAGRMLAIAKAMETFAAAHGYPLALDVARARRGRWFDPTLSDAVRDLGHRLGGRQATPLDALMDEVLALEPGGASVIARDSMLDRIALAFAAIVDGMSPFTAGHSHRVAAVAVEIGRRVGVPDEALPELRRAALFHDLGKLAVPLAMIEKPGPLDEDEQRTLRRHVTTGREILARVAGFARLAEIVGSHHERMDGSGYDRGLAGESIPIEARAIAVADVFDALSNARPYRPALPEDLALRIMERERGELDPDCMDALEAIVDESAGGDAEDLAA